MARYTLDSVQILRKYKVESGIHTRCLGAELRRTKKVPGRRCLWRFSRFRAVFGGLGRRALGSHEKERKGLAGGRLIR